MAAGITLAIYMCPWDTPVAISEKPLQLSTGTMFGYWNVADPPPLSIPLWRVTCTLRQLMDSYTTGGAVGDKIKLLALWACMKNTSLLRSCLTLAAKQLTFVFRELRGDRLNAGISCKHYYLLITYDDRQEHRASWHSTEAAANFLLTAHSASLYSQPGEGFLEGAGTFSVRISFSRQ